MSQTKKSDELKSALATFIKLYNKVRFIDGKAKIFPIDTSKAEIDNLYDRYSSEIIDRHARTGGSIDAILDDIIKQVTDETARLKQTLMDCEMLPFYGSMEYIVGRTKFINECLKTIPNVYNNIDEIVAEMQKVNDKYPINDIGNKEYTGEQFYAEYADLEEKYKTVLKLENELAPRVIQYWNSYLTDPSIHDSNNYHYVMHTFSAGMVDPSAMKKACCSLNTDELVITPYGDCGLIYKLDADSLETLCTEDVGSWAISKAEFVDRNCPNSWQLPNTDGSYSVFYEYEKNSKLIMPQIFQKKALEANVSYNGEMLNNSKHLCYSEIYLNNNAKAIGAFYTDNCKEVEAVEAYARKYNLPLVHISLSLQRELKGLPELQEISKN